MIFKIGDLVIYTLEGDICEVKAVGADRYLLKSRTWKGKNNEAFGGVDYPQTEGYFISKDSQLKLAIKKVRDTKLSRKMCKNYKIEGDYLIMEVG